MPRHPGLRLSSLIAVNPRGKLTRGNSYETTGGKETLASEPIDHYGVIGDMRTAALVATTGSIDWLCFPHFDFSHINTGPAVDRRGQLTVGRAQTVEGGLKDWFDVVVVALDPGNGDDHVEYLFEGEITTDLLCALRGSKEWPAGGEHPGAALSEDGVVAVRLCEQFGGDKALAVGESEEPAEPCDQYGTRRLTDDCFGRLAHGVNFVDVESLEEFPAVGKVAIERRHPDTGPS